MPKKGYLTDSEQKTIDALRIEGYTVRRIADAIKRSKSAVGSYLEKRTNNNRVKKHGRKPIIFERAARVLVKDARQGSFTAREVLHRSGVNASLRTVQRLLQNHEYMEFGKLAVRPKLTPQHIQARLKWAREYCFVSTRLWRKTVFTDEKRFCLDGTDGQA